MYPNGFKLPLQYNFRFKFPYPLQWGPPTFAAGHSFAMMSAVLVSMVEVLNSPAFCLHSFSKLNRNEFS